MIKITHEGKEQVIQTVLEGIIWKGAKDTAVRSLAFQFLCNNRKPDIPLYNVKCGDKVTYEDNNTLLFQGYVEKLEYNTDADIISVNCVDVMSHLTRSKCIKRFRGTLKEIAGQICDDFELINGITDDSAIIHNIVSNGDMSYCEVLKTACNAIYQHFALYIDGTILKLAEHESQGTFKIGQNIRRSIFSQDISKIVTKVVIIDKDNKIIDNKENSNELQAFGLFQEVYNYNKDNKKNADEINNLLGQKVKNKAIIVADNNNNCISGRFIKVLEPANDFMGFFEIKTDTHIINSDSYMELEIEQIYNTKETEGVKLHFT